MSFELEYSQLKIQNLKLEKGAAMKHSPKHGPESLKYLDDQAALLERSDALAAIKVRKKRARARSRRMWVWTQTLGFALASLLLMGAIFSVHAEYSKWQTRVTKREEELAALKTQLSVGEKRLAALQSPQGRKQLLVENGFLRPGDRILEFPADAEESRQAAILPNDLAPHADDWNKASAGGSMWRNAWNSLSERWENWRGTKSQIAAVAN